MELPFSPFLALRFLKPKRTFLSVITVVSVLGVTLGIAVLILVLSVMVGFDLELTPSVYICGAAGAVLGAILAYWGTGDMAIIIATTITFAVLSGIFGLFVPWYAPKK